MNDDKALKAREDELIENLNFFLRNYNRLIAIGYRKAVLDAEINWLEEELKKINRRIYQKETTVGTPTVCFFSIFTNNKRVMETKKKFLELKKAWINAKDNPDLRAKIDCEMDVFFSSLTDEQRGEVIHATGSEFGRIRTEITDINDTLNVRNLLADILPSVSVSHLSKKYFDKSASWFYQRMNGNLVNGKPAKFTPDELITLRRALDELSEKFSQTSKQLAV